MYLVLRVALPRFALRCQQKRTRRRSPANRHIHPSQAICSERANEHNQDNQPQQVLLKIAERKMASNVGDNSSAATEAISNTGPAVAANSSEGADGGSDFVNAGATTSHRALRDCVCIYYDAIVSCSIDVGPFKLLFGLVLCERN